MDGVGDAGLAVDATASELLLPEVEALLASLHGAEARARFVALASDLRAGRIGATALPALEQILALGIETGRFEKIHGRAADTLARGLYGRTPAGRARAEQASAVSAALAALAGTVLRALDVSADGPGGHRLTLETDRGEVLIRFDRSGVRIESVGVGA